MRTLRFLVVLFLTALFFSCAESGDLVELNRMNRELKRLERIESKMRSGSLTLADLAGLPGENLTPADPDGIQLALNVRYLEEFVLFTEHLKGEGLQKPGPEHSRAYKRGYRHQQKVRMANYRTFMKHLSRLEGDQLATLFAILKEADPAVRGQIYLLLNDMELSYYKNVGEINAPSADETLTFYSVKVDFGYDTGNKRMQTLLNENRKALTDITRNYFSGLTAEDMAIENEFLLKAGLLFRINKKLLSYDKSGRLQGVQDVAIINLQTFVVP
jgi:flagellar basal body-associated protein FliL